MAPTITQMMTSRVQPFQPTLNMRPEKESGGRGRPTGGASFSQNGSALDTLPCEGPGEGSNVASITFAGSWESFDRVSAIAGPLKSAPMRWEQSTNKH